MSELFDCIEIPVDEFVPNAQLPDPELFQFYKGLKERHLWLEGEVDETWMKYVKYIMEWNKLDAGVAAEKRKPIVLFINSCGGLLDICEAMVSTILASDTPVVGVNLSTAYSAGCDIFLACSKRYALKYSWFLIHRGSGGFSGNQIDARASSAQWDAITHQRHDFILSRINEDGKDEFEKCWDRDFYLSAEQAASFGMANKVVEHLSELPL